MFEIAAGERPETIPQGFPHVLFVEGREGGSFDPQLLRELIPPAVGILPLGSSFHIRSAAEALHQYHPNYYFLIDRDHYDDAFVEQCWDNFPDPKTRNLLVWPRRELENYFLIPEYLAKSQYLTVSEDTLRRTILNACRHRLYFDAANQVIVWLREEQKETWIETFKKASDFRTKDDALARLTSMPELSARKKRISSQVTKTAIKRKFQQILDELTDGKEPLEYGSGRWLELLRGKGVLPSVANKCFSVKDRYGRVLQGEERVREVVKDLLRKPLDDQPDDFQRLHGLIEERVSAA